MHKRFFLYAVLLIALSWSYAQSQSSGSSQGSSQQPDSSQQSGASSQSSAQGPQQTMEGCLAEVEHVYVLTDSSGAQHQLSGDTSQFKNDVGKQVKVRGYDQSSASSSATQGSSANQGSSSTGSQGSSGSSGGSASSGGQGTAGASSGTAASDLPVFAVVRIAEVADKCANK